uniref:C-type lectin domain-containing protein n=1 Tax=Macrostomum lignano TaxID=282301 RepID=A0A1I8GTV8_9PLAT
LEVPVHNIPAVQVEQRIGHVSHHVSRLGLVELHNLTDGVKQVATFDQLHHQVDLRASLVLLYQADNVMMLAHLHDANLIDHHVLLAAQLGLVNHLHGVFVSALLLDAGPDDGEVAVAHGFAQFEARLLDAGSFIRWCGGCCGSGGGDSGCGSVSRCLPNRRCLSFFAVAASSASRCSSASLCCRLISSGSCGCCCCCDGGSWISGSGFECRRAARAWRSGSPRSGAAPEVGHPIQRHRLLAGAAHEDLLVAEQVADVPNVPAGDAPQSAKSPAAPSAAERVGDVGQQLLEALHPAPVQQDLHHLARPLTVLDDGDHLGLAGGTTDASGSIGAGSAASLVSAGSSESGEAAGLGRVLELQSLRLLLAVGSSSAAPYFTGLKVSLPAHTYAPPSRRSEMLPRRRPLLGENSCLTPLGRYRFCGIRYVLQQVVVGHVPVRRDAHLLALEEDVAVAENHYPLLPAPLLPGLTSGGQEAANIAAVLHQLQEDYPGRNSSKETSSTDARDKEEEPATKGLKFRSLLSNQSCKLDCTTVYGLPYRTVPLQEDYPGRNSSKETSSTDARDKEEEPATLRAKMLSVSNIVAWMTLVLGLTNANEQQYSLIDGSLCINAEFVEFHPAVVRKLACASLCSRKLRCQAFSLADGPCQLFVFDKCSKSVRSCGCSRRGRVFVKQRPGLEAGALCPSGYGMDLCGVKYKLYSGIGTWWPSRQKCESESGLVIMADVTSEQEMSHVNSIYSTYSSGQSIWLGGLQPAGSAEPLGGWYWVGCNTSVGSFWAKDQPDNFLGGENVISKYLDFMGLTDIGGKYDAISNV